MAGTQWAAEGTPAVAAPPHPLSPLQDFVVGLSILLRGTVHEKLKWAFNLYDINKDGYITKEVLGWQACLSPTTTPDTANLVILSPALQPYHIIPQMVGLAQTFLPKMVTMASSFGERYLKPVPLGSH